MSRAVLTKRNILIGVVAFVLLLGAGSTWYAAGYARSHSVQVVTNASHQMTQLSYHGQNGVDALTLLKQHATVTTKHYSFGDMVESINGTAGNGPKYWTFYINGKEATVGAGAYQTKSGDMLMWRLQ